jgi:predicted phage terminase large subunit-like protein
MGALQWVDIPFYSAIIFRKTLREHQLPGALLERAKRWLKPWDTEVKFNGETYTFTFPSGATITFGYLDTKQDREHYLSTEFQYIAFDELTTFKDEADWDEMNLRLRKTNDMPMPLRIRGASNPGGPGHQWVMQKFIEPGTKADGLCVLLEEGLPACGVCAHCAGIPFIQADYRDNPFIDAGYAGALAAVKDPVRREQMRRGDWHILPEGKVLLRDWFTTPEEITITKRRARVWDFAATEAEHGQQNKKHDPDYTAGGLYSLAGHVFQVEDMVRGRWSPAGVADRVVETAGKDGPDVPIWICTDPGAAGLHVVDHFRRIILGGKYQVFGKHETGDKVSRVRAWAAEAQKGNVILKAAPWNLDFITEAVSMGTSDQVHDDQMDATSLAYQVLTLEGPQYEDWAEYYRDRRKGVRRPEPKMTTEEAENAQLLELEEREKKARARVEAERAKRIVNGPPRV